MSKYIKNINSTLNFFEKTLPEKTGEEPRLTQVQMAIDILGFLNSNDKCFISHAPVGIGKSYAALVPSIFHIKNRRGRIIYATHSLNLQTQLKHNELKELKSLGLIDNYLIAKGLTNYICKNKIRGLNNSFLEKKLLEVIAHSIEGDKVEIENKLGKPIDNNTWDKINLKVGSKCDYCPYFIECPTKTHREKFNNLKYKAIVTNHNQLIQSALNIKQGQEAIIDYFSEENIIIIDEAHHFESAAMNQIAKSITLNDLEQCVKKIKTQKDRFLNALKTLNQEMFKNRPQGKVRLSRRMLSAIRQIDKQLHHEMVCDISANKDSGELLEMVKEVTGRILSLDYSSWVDLADNSLMVIEKNYKKQIKNVIQELNKNNKLIFTSGTLEVNNSFNHLYFAWGGRPEKLQTKSYDTIFNLKTQAIGYIPRQDIIPIPPKSVSEDFREYCKIQYQEIKKLIEITKGRTLILCTSHEQVNYIYNFLKDNLDVKLLKQGQRSVELLTEEFKNNEQSVLIGTGAFFSGLSINNKSLISVILCRLPFPVPDDPFLELISVNLDNREAFKYVQFPHMMTKLSQALGRLIRTRNDFGCFTILDPRAYDYDYSEKILEDLNSQGLTITRDREDVRNFINDKLRGFSMESPQYNREEVHIPKLPKREPKKKIKTPECKPVKKPSYKIGCLTKDQIDYYMSLRKKANMSGDITNKIKRLSKDPYVFFKECVNVAEKLEEGYDVVNRFPYSSEKQEDNLRRRFRFENAIKSSEVLVINK